MTCIQKPKHQGKPFQRSKDGRTHKQPPDRAVGQDAHFAADRRVRAVRVPARRALKVQRRERGVLDVPVRGPLVPRLESRRVARWVVGDVVSVAVVLVARDERELQLDRAQRLVEIVVEKVRVARAWGKEAVLRRCEEMGREGGQG